MVEIWNKDIKVARDPACREESDVEVESGMDQSGRR
jgi:hypothetical protein